MPGADDELLPFLAEGTPEGKLRNAGMLPSAVPSAQPGPACRAAVVRGLSTAAGSTAAMGIIIFRLRGSDGAMLFLASYLMELSLSVDNMFAFYLIFNFYSCPAQCQGPVLFWGIIGAIALRAAVLLLGVAIISAAKPLMLLFAAALIVSAVQMISSGSDDDGDLEENRVVRCVRWMRVPVTSDYHGARFFVVEEGVLRATPLLLVLATIELSDIVFAVDSVPAVLGMSNDPLIAYSAVMCAVLCLRSIYTVTVMLMKSFQYLQYAVALLLLFIGVKIVLDVVAGITMPTYLSLAVIGATLAAGILASFVASREPKRSTERDLNDHL
uniref:Integral membrane protein TerC n=1 Tax=Chrysotila carterae TaxID=13221 RepID=A0A7S4B1P2_CHRCT|mmetsp:Transcript_6229/g.13599  ORF Transcript_6229/g.13599 Transcript_6229/m.13599 type:complete len:327 (+) Transcript_6229:215-1195(+)